MALFNAISKARTAEDDDNKAGDGESGLHTKSKSKSEKSAAGKLSEAGFLQSVKAGLLGADKSAPQSKLQRASQASLKGGEAEGADSRDKSREKWSALRDDLLLEKNMSMKVPHRHTILSFAHVILT